VHAGERLNSITHLVGAYLALIGFGALLTVSIQDGSPWMIAGFTVFGCSLTLLYSMSTLYHSARSPKVKRVFQRLDHVSIYLLIAGTYTPYMLVSLRDGRGALMMAVVWGLAVVGILMDAFAKVRRKAVAITIYLVMGWVSVLEFDNLQDALSSAGVTWLVAGGIAYTVGVIFYVMDAKNRMRHAHGIWHLFVLVGSGCHFISILGYVR